MSWRTSMSYSSQAMSQLWQGLWQTTAKWECLAGWDAGPRYSDYWFYPIWAQLQVALWGQDNQSDEEVLWGNVPISYVASQLFPIYHGCTKNLLQLARWWTHWFHWQSDLQFLQLLGELVGFQCEADLSEPFSILLQWVLNALLLERGPKGQNWWLPGVSTGERKLYPGLRVIRYSLTLQSLTILHPINMGKSI